jgi:hypothetical protein
MPNGSPVPLVNSTSFSYFCWVREQNCHFLLLALIRHPPWMTPMLIFEIILDTMLYIFARKNWVHLHPAEFAYKPEL